MRTSQTKLGADHPGTLSMGNLGFTWRGVGRHRDSLGLIQTCCKRRYREFGLNHPNTQSTLIIICSWIRRLTITRRVPSRGQRFLQPAQSVLFFYCQ